MSEVLGTIQLIAALRPGPLGPRRLARAVGRTRPVIVTLLRDRSVVGAIEDRCERLDGLRHPALGRVRAVIRYQGGLAMVEDTLDGVPFSMLIEQGPIPSSVAVAMIRRVFRALHIGWNRTGREPAEPGLIHGDLNPDHVWVEPGAKVKVLGVGTIPKQARALDPYRPSEAGRTPYCAPDSFSEQDQHRSDVYSAACILGALLTGEPPGHASSDLDWHASVVRSMRRKLSDNQVEARLEDLIRECMNFDSSARPSASQVSAALEDIQGALQGPRKEVWCAEFLPILMGISRGERKSARGDSTPVFTSASESSSLKASPAKAKAVKDDQTDPRPPRPPPLMTPAQVPSYDDIMVDPDTGEVSWGEASSLAEAESSEESGDGFPDVEMIPPDWTLEEDDDETDEVPFPFGRVELPLLDDPSGAEEVEVTPFVPPTPSVLEVAVEETTDPYSAPPVVESPELQDDGDSTTEAVMQYFDPDAGDIEMDASAEDVEWGARSGPPRTLIVLGILVVLFIFLGLGWDPEVEESSADSSEMASSMSSPEPERSEPSEPTEAGEVTTDASLSTMNAEGEPVDPEPDADPPEERESVSTPERDDDSEPDRTREATAAPADELEPASASASAPNSEPVSAPSPEPQADGSEAALSAPTEVVESESDVDAPAEPTAQVRIASDAQTGITLLGSGRGNLSHGQTLDVPPGDYTIEAFFQGGLSKGQRYGLRLEAGDTVTVKCVSMAQRCICQGGASCSSR